MFAGQVFDQERRMVVRRDPVGDPAPGQVAAVRRARRPPGGRQPVAHARRRRPVRVPAAAGVQPGHLRPDARMLAPARIGQARVPRNPPVPAAQEPGLLAGRGRVMTVGRQARGRSGPGRRRRQLAVRVPGKRHVSTSSAIMKK